ncbi:hypothetical protein [Psychromonas sp. MME2]|uniref:hypothetical protein n=1 Tax=unclassified Psychromonas TaxID=2614957 RepID=UPI00339C6381
MSKAPALTPNTDNNFIALIMNVSKYDNIIYFNFHLETPICFYFDRDSGCLLPVTLDGNGHHSLNAIDNENNYKVEGLFDIKTKTFNCHTARINNVTPDNKGDLYNVIKTIVLNNYKYKKSLDKKTKVVIKEQDSDITKQLSLK